MKAIARYLGCGFLTFVVLVRAAIAFGTYEVSIVAYPGASTTHLSGLNNFGLVAGSATFEDGTVGFLYDIKKGTFSDLPALPPHSLSAFGVNDAGVVVGSVFIPSGSPPYSTNGNDVGFVLRNGVYTLFSYPGFPHTFARGIGTSGLVTGNAYSTAFYQNGDFAAFIYDPTSEHFIDIKIPGALYITPQGIDSSNRVVGNVFLTDDKADPASPPGEYSHGFVREPDGTVTLFKINSQETAARGINELGQITGVVETGVPGEVASFVITIPTPGGYRSLRVPDSQLIRAESAPETHSNAIDNSGRIVGGLSTGRAFIAVPRTTR